ncbi:MAG TPA: 3-oxoacyl-[acyl-carrier-protein] synthase III C-terminal domain-containing protein [Bryobacteraceae bacterium]|nr:3-oxoacyl-[acyl-carrier-protein] synthase III C-terminal domain-containing protein [Bryobacteraceae bacterium]
MFITGLGTATPPQCYTQQQCWDLAKGADAIRKLSPRSQALLRKVLLGDNGIQTRFLALNSLDEIFQSEPDALHRRFAEHAPSLATQAANAALRNAGLEPGSIDALLVSTCTGYLCPGLTSYVSERLGLAPDAILLDLVGQGCGAALPNLVTAEALVASGRAERVLSVCVEICSAAFYLDDDPGVLISACLFGDGAGAAVLAAQPSPHGRRLEWKTAQTHTSPADRDYLRFEQRDGKLRNILTKQVPELAAKYAEHLLSQVLAATNLRKENITTWIMHAGGQNILTALRDRLGLTTNQLRWSAEVLRRHGNLSSPCVLFVLQAAMRGEAPHGHWWLSSFGAGFACHGALLAVS